MKTNKETAYTIFFEPDLNCVVMEWKGYATSEQFREGTELMLNSLIKNKTTKVLADIQDMVIIGTEDQHWLNSLFLPRAMQFGFKSVAIIKPNSYFNKVAVESVSDKINKEELAINFFESKQHATEWLKSIN